MFKNPFAQQKPADFLEEQLREAEMYLAKYRLEAIRCQNQCKYYEEVVSHIKEQQLGEIKEMVASGKHVRDSLAASSTKADASK